MGWIVYWVQKFYLTVGWVGSDQLFGGLRRYKIDQRTTLESHSTAEAAYALIYKC